MKTGYWEPVYKTGCGWRECPECGPRIELEIQAEHERMVERTVLGPRIADWIAEAYGTGEERVAPVIQLREKKQQARASQAKARKERRIKRVLTAEQRTEALTILKKQPVLRTYRREGKGRDEWLAEVWLELENPTVLVAGREGSLALAEKVNKAVSRAQKSMRERSKGNARMVSFQDLVRT